MEKITYRFTLDMHKTGVQRMLQGFETNTTLARRIALNLTESGNTYELPLDRTVAFMYVTTPGSDTPSVYTCTIDDNTIIYDDIQIVVPGITIMQVKLIETSVDGAASVIASPKFGVEVRQSETDDSGAEQSAEFSALEDLAAQAQAMYDSRLVSIEVDENGVFRVEYADGQEYESQSYITYIDSLAEKAFEEYKEEAQEYVMRAGVNASLAGTHATTAKDYSNQAETHAYSASQFAQQAEASATNAEASATNAEASATNAEASATNAEASATNAEASATDAESSATDAESSATSAKEYSDLAESSATSASGHESLSKLFAERAESSATSASGHESLSKLFAERAESSATSAEESAVRAEAMAGVCVNGLTGVEIKALYDEGKRMYADTTTAGGESIRLFSGGSYNGYIMFSTEVMHGVFLTPCLLYVHVNPASTSVADFSSVNARYIAEVYNGLDIPFDTGKSLSAYQGYVLDQKIVALQTQWSDIEEALDYIIEQQEKYINGTTTTESTDDGGES